jgi:hypothetical protein
MDMPVHRMIGGITRNACCMKRCRSCAEQGAARRGLVNGGFPGRSHGEGPTRWRQKARQPAYLFCLRELDSQTPIPSFPAAWLPAYIAEDGNCVRQRTDRLPGTAHTHEPNRVCAYGKALAA